MRKRYAALVAAMLIPAIASATEWPTTPQAQQHGPAGFRLDPAALDTAAYERAAYERAAYDPQIHADTDASTTAGDAIGGPAARPFFASGSGLDRVRAEQCLTMAIYYEAATQPDDGQRAVAQVVLNRVAHPSFPNTVCGVVFQGSERSTGCQFTFACDGSLARRPMAFWWDRARRVADAALAGYVYAPVRLATHYHTLAVHPYWSDSLVPVITIGAHRFYRWPGAAGQKAAFQVAYYGGEPAAAPRPKVFTPAPESDPDPIALARAYEARLPRTVPLQAAATAPAPVYSAEIAARGGDALYRADNLPAGGALSPELQRSGQWLQRP
ncbi:MAG: cell wall hydrolase [Croceibacterium sp.]